MSKILNFFVFVFQICFHCRLKKFYIFSRPYTCQICKRKVCGKCLKKVKTFTIEYYDNLV